MAKISKRARKELRINENEMANLFGDVKGFFIENQQIFRIGLISATVLLVIAMTITWTIQNRNARAYELLNQAMAEIAQAREIQNAAPQEQQTETPVKNPEENLLNAVSALESATENYSKSRYGDENLFLLAATQYDLEQYDNALKSYQQFIQQYPDHMMIAAAHQAIAYIHMQKGDYQSARESLLRLESLQHPYYPEDQFLFDLAHCLDKCGKLEDARNTFQKLTEAFPESKHVSVARERISALQT